MENSTRKRRDGEHRHRRSKHDDDHRRSDERHRRRSDTRDGDRLDRERSRSVERKKGKEQEDNGREKRRFTDDGDAGKGGEGFGFGRDYVTKDSKYESRDEIKGGDVGSVFNNTAIGPNTSDTSPETFVAHSDNPASKVTSISKTNENKGVNINRSHEVPGKSSMGGTGSDASKSGGLSLDVLSKAKITLQKELKERLCLFILCICACVYTHCE